MSAKRGWIGGVKGVLLDVDGTLWEAGRQIPGAAETLQALQDAGIAVRLTTNTTRRPRRAIAAALGEVGLFVDPSRILVPASLAARRIAASGRRRTGLMVPRACAEDMEGIEIDTEGPDWVVMGDLGREFTFDRLNQAFHWLRGGATLLALQRGRSWLNEEGNLELDAGAFIAALEYAAEVEAELVGKPAKPFFDLALDELGLQPREVLVVGDDVDNDIGGGRRAGLRTALVQTGKQRELGSPPPVPPDLTLESIADLRPA